MYVVNISHLINKCIFWLICTSHGSKISWESGRWELSVSKYKKSYISLLENASKPTLPINWKITYWSLINLFRWKEDSNNKRINKFAAIVKLAMSVCVNLAVSPYKTRLEWCKCKSDLQLQIQCFKQTYTECFWS